MKVGDVVLVVDRQPRECGGAGVIVKVRGEELFDVLYRGIVQLVHIDWLELI
jgi:hypothetical protein